MKRFIPTSIFAGLVLPAFAATTTPLWDTYPAVKAHTDKVTVADDDTARLKQLLFAASPLPDLLNTPAETWTAGIEATLRAQREMPWSGNVPTEVFDHFVLPMRINNEPVIDNHRPVIYAELRDRVKDKSMEEAALEVNHWCHEYVTYQPSDGRTHTPLESMSSCIGRCGEESTFTVAAMRAVGIPARQVYTPRWAHTDDNHAWVEVWIDGKWHFLGACEPEPRLNMAWFNAPATRGMMMHTFVRGDYRGADEVTATSREGVNINVTANYAPVVPVEVTVVDTSETTVEGADVSFRLYNYAEFYPLATKKSDSAGHATLTTGRGDMLIWANTPDGRFGYTYASAGEEPITVVLDSNTGGGNAIDFTLVPPPQGTNIVTATDEETAANKARLASEDALRQSRIPPQSDPLLVKARGNAQTISDFIASVPVSERDRAMKLLNTLPEKDLTDTGIEVLRETLLAPGDTSDFSVRYVMSPRIEIEHLTPWRSALRSMIAKEKTLDVDATEFATAWQTWLADNLTMVDNWTPSSVTVFPVELMTSRIGNERSRDLLFVAGCRARGVAARVDPVTGLTQWADDTQTWHTLKWDAAPEEKSAKRTPGSLVIDYSDSLIEDPAYYANFSICRLDNGQPSQLEFDEFAKLTALAPRFADLDPGQYMLVSGQRLADGTVLSRVRFFDIEPGKTTRVPLEIRHDTQDLQVIGSLNAENRYSPLSADLTAEGEKSLLETTGRGYYAIVVVRDGHEPSNHVLRDLKAVETRLKGLGVPMVVLYETAPAAEIVSLRDVAAIGVDTDGRVATELQGVSGAGPEAPFVAIADTFNRVVWLKSGYTIGSGDALVSALKRLPK